MYVIIGWSSYSNNNGTHHCISVWCVFGRFSVEFVVKRLPLMYFHLKQYLKINNVRALDILFKLLAACQSS